MTPRQRDALAFIRTFIAATGTSPSYDEIAVALGLKNKSGVHRLVLALVEQGALRRPFTLARLLAAGSPRVPMRPERSSEFWHSTTPSRWRDRS